ncbi:MAG TPA: PepSY-associated TM helix domain-containing protein [Thermoanaerobaculia bacterium]
MRWLLVIHRWIGLAASVFLLLASLSGALLVFRDAQPDSAWGRFLAAVLQIHVRLLAGGAGDGLVNGATVAVLFLVPTGLILWWRKPRYSIRRRGSARRMLIDLHNVLGFYSAAFVLLLAATGALLAFEAPLTSAFRLPEWQEQAPPHSTLPRDRAATPNPQRFMTNARHAIPGATVTRIVQPRRATSAVRIEMRGPGAFDRSTVYVDRYSGAVLRIDDLRQAPWWYRLQVAARAIHTGDVYGLTGKLVALVTTLFAAFLAVTGVLMWLKSW